MDVWFLLSLSDSDFCESERGDFFLGLCLFIVSVSFVRVLYPEREWDLLLFG